MVKNSYNKSVIDLLQLHSVCPRCILRFLGVRTYNSYSSKDEVKKVLNSLENTDDSSNIDVIPLKSSDHSPKRHHSATCSLCLGILQEECDKMPERIHAAVRKSGYQFSDFVLQLSVPAVIDLRQCLMSFYVEEQLGEFKPTDKEIPSVKEVWKWVVGLGLSKALDVEFEHHSSFQISVSIIYQEFASECNKLLEACPEAFPNRRKAKASLDLIFNRTSVMKAIELLDAKLPSLYTLPPESPEKPCNYEGIVCSHSPLYLAGRYNKYSRELSQTPWLVDGERRMESSVQELITTVVKKWIKCDEMIFSASGREDVDVKMLGNGRPFVLEVINPRRVRFSLEDMKTIENEINSSTSSISVSLFQVIFKSEIKNLKEGEELKRKSYLALCFVKKELTSADLEVLADVKDLTLKQKTPIRVLHRRPLATRDKVIHKIDGKILGPHSLEVRVETQAGTYVKEFVHSDFGRTVPNLGTLLGTEADILELDVESIHLDWPPQPGLSCSTEQNDISMKE